MTGITRPYRVSLLAFPDAVMSTLVGLYDVLNAFKMLAGADQAIPAAPPFQVEIVGLETGHVTLSNGMTVMVQRAVRDVAATDILIVPSVLVGEGGWQSGRHPELVEWAARMHAGGAVLCSACSGIFLLAESGLFNGQAATVHWGYAGYFGRAHPAVPLMPERVLVISGEREDLISSGASTSWHDLAMYLIARYVGTTAAQALSRFFALQWHHEGLSPFIVFRGRTDHDDLQVAEAQKWLAGHFSVTNPIEEMIRRSGVAERTFKRRFTAATGHAPLEYIQRLRVEDAKRRLERTEDSVDEISWKVGYEDPAFFRRLFKRTTGLAPGAYRRKFRVPSFITSPAG